MTGVFQDMGGFFQGIGSWLSFLPRITLPNLIEIGIIAFLVYEILLWIKNTRAWNLLKGIAMILAFALVAAICNFDTILWILERTASIAAAVKCLR